MILTLTGPMGERRYLWRFDPTERRLAVAHAQELCSLYGASGIVERQGFDGAGPRMVASVNALRFTWVEG